MTQILCEELRTTLSKSFTLTGTQVWQVNACRPKLVMYNAPSGTFTLSIKSGANTLGSADFTSADIKSDLNTSNNYAYIHKVLQFTNDIPLRAGTYTAELSSSGYTYSVNSFIGWVKETESVFETIVGTINNETNYPFTMQLFENKRAIYA